MEHSVLLLKALSSNPPAFAGRSRPGSDCYECLSWVGRLAENEDLGGRGHMVLTENFDETLDVRSPGALELTLPFAMAYQDLDDTQCELA